MDALLQLEFYKIVTSLVVAVVLSHLLRLWLRRRQLPPGPAPLPVFGNALSLSPDKKAMIASFRTLRRTYGDVSTLHFGSTPVVILQGYKAIFEGLVKGGGNCSVRYPLTNYVTFLNDLGGFAASRSWREQRKFAIETFRLSGVGSESHERKVHEEIGHFVRALRSGSAGGQPFDLRTPLRKAIANVVLDITIGRRLDYGDESLLKMLELAEQFDSLVPAADMALLFPFLKYLPGRWQRLAELKAPMVETVSRLVSERRASMATTTTGSTCYVDRFLHQLDCDADAAESGFTESDLVSNLFSLFAGGTDTTTATLMWALLYCVANQDTQLRIQKEVDSVVDKGSYPSLRDRPHMPFTEAFVTEILRLPACPILTLPYTTAQTMEVCGVRIPAGSAVMANLVSACCDESVYPEPMKFCPERHLDASGHYIKPENSFIPFSTGRRSCPGEHLAKAEIFLFLTAILQSYRLAPGDADTLTIKASSNGAIYSPAPFKCFLQPR